MRSAISAAVSILVPIMLLTSCVTDPVSLIGCRFRIESTEDFYLDGIRLDDLAELSASQTAQVTAALNAGECMVSFAVNVTADNPDDTGGVTIMDFDWDALMDSRAGAGRTDIWVDSGGLETDLTVPNSSSVIMPLVVEFDAADRLLGDMTVEEIITMCLAVGGSTSDVRDGDHLGIINFEVTITEDTPLGLILINFPVTLGIDWIQPE